ncbi:hypothetical protein NL676_009091 [Syzygium grande]|nr:hypothetical protein NL676_009091 [Syzygium grande]
MALPPTDFSSLSQLQSLCVSCADSRSLTRLPSSLQWLSLEDVQSPIDWSLFSNLENLSTLDIAGYTLGEIRFEVLGQPPKFNELRITDCPSLETLTVPPDWRSVGVHHWRACWVCHNLANSTSRVARGLTETDKIDNLSKGAYGQALQNLNEMRLNYLPFFP